MTWVNFIPQSFSPVPGYVTMPFVQVLSGMDQVMFSSWTGWPGSGLTHSRKE